MAKKSITLNWYIKRSKILIEKHSITFTQKLNSHDHSWQVTIHFYLKMKSNNHCLVIPFEKYLEQAKGIFRRKFNQNDGCYHRSYCHTNSSLLLPFSGLHDARKFTFIRKLWINLRLMVIYHARGIEAWWLLEQKYAQCSEACCQTNFPDITAFPFRISIIHAYISHI